MAEKQTAAEPRKPPQGGSGTAPPRPPDPPVTPPAEPDMKAMLARLTPEALAELKGLLGVPAQAAAAEPPAVPPGQAPGDYCPWPEAPEWEVGGTDMPTRRVRAPDPANAVAVYQRQLGMLQPATAPKATSLSPAA